MEEKRASFLSFSFESVMDEATNGCASRRGMPCADYLCLTVCVSVPFLVEVRHKRTTQRDGYVS